MEPETVAQTPSDTPALPEEQGDAYVHGYTRESVDEFLASVERARASLQESIKEARLRESRAQGIIGMHQVMVAMMLESHRALGARRRDAETQASEIVRNGEREAEAILRAAYEDVGAAWSPEPSPSEGLPTGVEPSQEGALPPRRIIDLTVPDEEPVREPLSEGDLRFAPPVGASSQSPPDPVGDEFFSFLRGALVDEEPLGPRSD